MSEATFRITAPDSRTRDIVGVPFADGVGFTADPARLAFFERRGWDMEPVTELIGEPLTPEQEAELAALTAQGLTVPVLNLDGTVTPGTIPGSGEFVPANGDAEAAAAQEQADEAAKQAEADRIAAEAQKVLDDAAEAEKVREAEAAEAAKTAEAEKAATAKAAAKPAAKSITAKK